MSKIPGFIEVERRVLSIAGGRVGAKSGRKGNSRDIRTRDVVLWWRRNAISAERLAKAPRARSSTGRATDS